MRRCRSETVGRRGALLCFFCLLLTGCAVVGPDAIRGGRLAYNQAITETNNQQMLMVLVHNRYEETNQLLAVSSVTANVSVSSSARIEAGFGDSNDYDGNLVPFSGGFVYEENPTISYAPIAGETYIRQLMAPVPLANVAQIAQSLPRSEFVYGMLVASVNDIYNPAFLYGEQQDDPRFDRFADLMSALTYRHCLHWAQEDRNAPGVEMIIHAAAGCADPAREIADLLALDSGGWQGEHLRVPVTPWFDRTGPGSIGLTTRSIWNLVEILSAVVEVPPADEQAGWAAPFPRPGRTGRDLRIAYAKSRPEDAYVAVEHGDGWFYIDRSDLDTKRYFKLLSSLWSAAMAKSLGVNTGAPVLTVPVSR